MSTQTDQINSMYDNETAAKLKALQQARNNQINTYNQQIGQLPGQYDPLKNQASFQGAKALNSVNEKMANNGLAASGDNQTAQLMSTTSTANNINTLNANEQAAVDKLKNAIAQVNANGQLEDEQAKATIESQRNQALINQMNADRAYNLQAAASARASSGYGSGSGTSSGYGSGSGTSSASQKSQEDLYSEFVNQFGSDGKNLQSPYDWLHTNADRILSNGGKSFYDMLYDAYNSRANAVKQSAVPNWAY